MRKLASLLLLCVAFTLAACGATSTTPTTGGSSATATTAPTDTPAATATSSVSAAATISFGRSNFIGNTSITIKAGQAVLFDDPASGGGIHILVIGKNGQFTAMSGAPSEFNSSNGTPFSPGDQKTVTFATAGVYPITCTIHPTMLVTVTVKA